MSITTRQRTVDGPGHEGVILVKRDEVVAPDTCDKMVGPSVFRHGGGDGVIIIAANTNLLFSQTDIVVELGVCARAARLEHEGVAVVERQASDEHMAALVAVAVKPLHAAAGIAVNLFFCCSF